MENCSIAALGGVLTIAQRATFDDTAIAALAEAVVAQLDDEDPIAICSPHHELQQCLWPFWAASSPVQRVAHLMERPEARRPFVALIAASQHDPQLAAALRERFVAGRRAAATDLLDQICEQHPDRAHADPDIIIDLTYGALYYRLLITGQDLDVAHVDRLLDATVGPIARPRAAHIGDDA